MIVQLIMSIITGKESHFPMVVVRRAKAADKDAILSVNRLSWQEAYKHIFTEDEIAQLFKGDIKQQGTWLGKREQRLSPFVAEENQTVIGFIGMASLLNDTAAEITSFYILPEKQGKGLGKQLWQAAVDTLREEGYTGAWVWVLEKAEARKFYEGRGCVEKARGIYSIGEHDEETIGYFLDFGGIDGLETEN
jgi:GNAT superfamily N-acetyltransferase